MPGWFQQSFEEHSILWFLISSVVGGVIGASARFVFDVILPQRLQQSQKVIAIKRKYATPILLAADELRCRLRNIITHIEAIEHEGWLSHGYYPMSTLYVLGQFFGWLYILRRTVVYLDFTTTRETRKFERFLMAIEAAFTDPALLSEATTGIPWHTDDKWIFSFWLQAIGGLMVTCENEEYRTIDYASFHKALSQPQNTEFKRWFDSLESVFQDLKADDVRFRRIVAAHIILNAFVEYADPQHLRTDQHPFYWQLLPDQEAERIKKRISMIDAR